MSRLVERVRSVVLDGTVRRKLSVAFVAVAVLAAAVGVVGAYAVADTSASANQIQRDSQAVDDVMTLKLESQRERATLLKVLRGEKAESEFQDATQSFNSVYEGELASSQWSLETEALLAETERLHESAVESARLAMDAKAEGDTAAMRDHLATYESKQVELQERLTSLEKRMEARLSAEAAAATRTERNATIAVAGLALVAFAGAVGIGRRVGGNIGGEAERASAVADRIAAGETDVTVERSCRNDELGDLSASFQSMTDYLGTATEQARAVADQRFDADVLDEDVPGELGDAMATMVADIEAAQREAEAATERAEAAKADVEELNERLEARADAYQETMAAAADGDLSVRMAEDAENDAMAAIAVSFNEMMDDLAALVTTLDEFADEVVTASEAVNTSTDEIRAASEDVSESVQDIAATADEQNRNLTQVNEELQGLSGSIEEIASAASEVASNADDATEHGTSSREAATDAIEEMAAIRETADETVAEVESLADEVAEIEEIVAFITDIAEQTNMLALNASIEAARAGEAGEGFAVVADEIKGLASEVEQATDDIEGLIEDVQSSTDAAVSDMRDLDDRVVSGTDTIESTVTDLEDIVARVEEVNGGVQEISEATDDQAASTEEAVSMVEEVADGASDTSEAAEQVSAAAEEQAASLADVADRVGDLAERADDLQGVVDQFAVDDAADPAGPTVDESAGASASTVSDGGQPDEED
jgi:methyl-accepting chemotaxis protein